MFPFHDQLLHFTDRCGVCYETRSSWKIPPPLLYFEEKPKTVILEPKDGRDWMTAAKNMDKWHRGVERGAEALDSAWRRADLRQSNVQLQR